MARDLKMFRQGNAIVVDETQQSRRKFLDYSKEFAEDLRKRADPDDEYDEQIAPLPDFELWKGGHNMGWTKLPIVTRKKAFWSTPLGITREGVIWQTSPQWVDNITPAPPLSSEVAQHLTEEQEVAEQPASIDELLSETTSSSSTGSITTTPLPIRPIVTMFKGIPVADTVEKLDTDVVETISRASTTPATLRTTMRPRMRTRPRTGPVRACRLLDAAKDGEPSERNDASCPLSWPGIPADDTCKCTYDVAQRDEHGCATGFIYTCARVVV